MEERLTEISHPQCFCRQASDFSGGSGPTFTDRFGTREPHHQPVGISVAKRCKQFVAFPTPNNPFPASGNRLGHTLPCSKFSKPILGVSISASDEEHDDGEVLDYACQGAGKCRFSTKRFVNVFLRALKCSPVQVDGKVCVIPEVSH
ncbi:Protein NPP-1, isoform b [Anopheles sinensis]|uniref:Protein NPP-1, isoform b n=1 Tax=Anopheles sinensis TaxID=74873 RepID=A0A084W3D6_ANOSI|nr:Protein NPP-1, isoform b [Anopheles sinensis]